MPLPRFFRCSSLASRLTAAGLVTAAALGATAASAQQMVNARVLSATPVAESVPVQGCTPGAYGPPSGAGAGVGAVVGGLIGSQVGKGNGHIAGAILGALGGAVLGNTAEAHNRAYGYGNCATRYENRVVGYDVTYEYAGRQYSTRMAQPPGPWLQIPAPGADPYYGQGQYGYGDSGAQTYPVNPPPVAAYPLPAYPAAGDGVVQAPADGYGGYAAPVYGQPYPQAYPQPYPQPYPGSYPAPVYPQPVYPPQVVYAPRPAFVSPVGVNLSVGGVFGGRRHGHGGVGVGIGF